MPRPPRRSASRRLSYTDQERRVLLTGVPVSHVSTRFGHPKTGWDREAIAEAWSQLETELMDWWESPEFDVYRARNPHPLGERVLEGELL